MLHFLFGLLIVGTIIVMMVAYPAFRYFIFLLVIAGGIGIWALIENNSKQAREADQRRVAEQQFAATAIKTGDVQLDDVKLTKTNYGTSEFVLSGTITNNSQYTLGSLTFEVTMTDCSQGKCITVGQKTTSVSVQVPSTQRRAFNSYTVRFDDLPPANGAARSWKYKLLSTRLN